MPTSTSNMDKLEASLLDRSTPLDNRFRTLFTIKGLATSSDDHLARAIQIISKGFSDDSALLKHELAYVLGQLEDVRALPVLRSVLSDLGQEVMVRHEAAEAMGAISCPSSLPILNEYLNDVDVSVRETCQLAIQKIEFDNTQKGKEIRQRNKLAKSENKIGDVEAAFAPIDPAPAMSSSEAALAAAAALEADSKDQDDSSSSSFTLESLPKFRSVYLDPSLSLFERYRAMFSLRNVAHSGGREAAREAVLCLAEGLKDSSALFRHEICFVFGELCHPASIPSMLDVLNDEKEHEMVRHEAAEALGGIVEESSQEGEASKDGFQNVFDSLKRWAEDMECPRVVRESCVVALDEMAYNNDPNQFQRVEV
ncbi:Deoxyhypusine hydroxylase [Violaceomyces palustris]|uniref:Deoxyhypusine hydroxylase n=1 Tax=Violaceomyces palustris TaxID=1673888 RepID=A0ACD0NRQ1_9BASI|nr:Deoxyhypusine hydroxylase [Violaceomyces palustris]